ncbi:arginase family protein [Streptomyces parvus]|uniref:hypothetical protein n=1 Tax=Streptomyces parvus TaxID=66428 RepID=UPI003638732E
MRAAGAPAAARHAVNRLTGGSHAGYWVHLDVDVLDDAIMPAVDHRLPGGLDVTIFNPRRDPEGTIAARLTECLRRGLSMTMAS